MSAQSLEIARARQHEQRYWTADRIVGQLRLFHETTGRTPRARDLRPGGPVKLPSSDICVREFGSWNNAVEAAGFTPAPRTGGRAKGSIPGQSRNIRGLNACPRCGDLVWTLRWSTGWCVPCSELEMRAA